MLTIINILIGSPFFILFIALILLFIEITAIINYRQKDCQLVEYFIDFLAKNQEQKIFLASELDRNKKGLFNYFVEHLEGENINYEFHSHKKNNFFCLSFYPQILTQSIPRSPVYFAPTLLTALGILGTFLGIFFGLQKVGVGNIEATQDLLEASTTLLAGMKTAFSTSLAGLGSASLMMITLAIGSKLRQDRRNKLRKKLSQIAFVESPQALLSRFDTSSIEKASDSMENVARSLHNFTESFSADNFAQAITNSFVADDNILLQQLKSQTTHLEYLTSETIVSRFEGLLTSIKEELTSLRQIQTQQQSNLELEIKQLTTELVTPVIERLEETAQITASASSAVNQLKDELGGISQNLVTAVSTINSFQENTLSQMQSFTQTLQTTLQQFNQDTKGVLETVAVEMKQAVTHSIQAMETQREAFQLSSQETSATFRQIREDLQMALTTQATQQKEMLQEVETATAQVLRQAKEGFAQQGEMINQTMAQSVTAIETQREAFVENAQQASASFRGIREELQQALTIQGTQQQEMLEGVRVSTESILVKANQAFRQQTETITQVGKEASQLLNQSKENLLETLMNIDDILDKTRVTLQDELQTFRLEYQSALTQFFSEQNNLLDETLGRQKQGLSLVVEDLQNTFKNEAQARSQLTTEVNQSLLKIQETTSIVSELVNQAQTDYIDRFNQMKELANANANQAEKVTQAYDKMTDKYSESLELMTSKLATQTTQMNDHFETLLNKIIEEFNQLTQQTNQQISDYLTTADNSYRQNLTEADVAMANICSQLNSTSDGLMNVAEYIVASVNDLKSHG